MRMTHSERPCAVRTLDMADPMAGNDIDTQDPAAVDERIKHGPRLVRRGEELAGLFMFEWNAHPGKPLDGPLNGKTGKHILDDAPVPEEVGAGDRLMGDVASPSA